MRNIFDFRNLFIIYYLKKEQSKIEVISYQKHSIATILITTNDQFKVIINMYFIFQEIF